MRPLSVLIADDHPLFREGVREGLTKAGIVVCGEATTGEEAVRIAHRLRPDVLLLDIRMPDGNGWDVLRRLAREKSGLKVLILSAYETDEYLRAAVRGGARGYLLKEASSRELVEAVRAVAAGRTYFSRSAAELLLEDVVAGQGAVVPGELSPREEEVLTLIAEGLTNKEAAARLGLSVRTVESHRQALMNKLDLRGTAALTRYAIEHGLASPRKKR